MVNENMILKQLYDNTSDGILFCDKEGIIRMWNKGCEKIFGFTTIEAEGSNLDIIIPEKYRKRHWNGFFESVETAKTKYAEKLLSVPALTKSGNIISIAFSIVMVKDTNTIIGFGAIVRDVTQEFNEKRELKEKLNMKNS